MADPGPVSVLPLPDLRRQVPERFRGPVFDATVLQLADEQQVRIYQDADPLKYTPEERAERVRVGVDGRLGRRRGHGRRLRARVRGGRQRLRLRL